MPGAVKLVALPAKSISQDDIEELISLDNQIRDLERQRDALASSLLKQRIAGIEVEHGMFRLEVVTEASAGRREHRLAIR